MAGGKSKSKSKTSGAEILPEIGTGLSLEEWLAAIQDPNRARKIITYQFPTDRHRREYLSDIGRRTHEELRYLLRCFLMRSGSLGCDDSTYRFLIQRLKTGDQIDTEYERRLILYKATKGRVLPWEGITWIVDLAPYAPRKALDVLDAYLETHAGFMPDGRLVGMSDARAIIRAKYILSGDVKGSERALDKLTPRELEVIVAALYRAMGYKTHLTPSTKDGGRDIIAKRKGAARRELCLVECKHHDKPIRVKEARAFMFVVNDERATKGVLVSSSRFTAGTKNLARRDKRLDLVDRSSLVRLLNEYLGISWPLKIDRLIATESKLHESPAN